MPALETVERIGECRRLDRLEIDHLADQHGAAQVGRQQPQALARVVVGNAIAFMTEDHEAGDAGRRSLERREDIVDPALRPRPFLVEIAIR